MMWAPFSKKELHSVIENYNNFLAPRLDKLSQRHLKVIIKNDKYVNKLIDIANVCINLGHWPNHFKTLSMVIIPKLKKPSYDLSKSFQPIVLLNTIGKLFEKMIGERLQFLLISNNFVHLCQLDELKHRSITNAGIALTHLIRKRQVKSLTSTLAFNIVQFFPSLNYQLLSLILAKASFNHKISNFFKNYLIRRKTKYPWNKFSSFFYNVDVGVSQGLALFPILSALYLSPLFYILEKWLKNLKIPISILSFVDNSLFISQHKSISVLNANLFCSYNIFSSLLIRFRLVVEYGKTEVFHFSRLHGDFNPPPLDLTPLRSRVLLPKPMWQVLLPKPIWQYLGFYFDYKLLFHSYINFYMNKAISTIKYMKMLGNLSRGLAPLQKRQLYICCMLPIILYGFQLQYYNKAPLNYPLCVLRKMQ